MKKPSSSSWPTSNSSLRASFFFFFFHYKHVRVTFVAKSSLAMHKEPKLKLKSHLGPKFELRLFFWFVLLQALWSFLGTDNSLVAYDESEFKRVFHLGFELEFGFIYLFIFVVGPTKLLLAPRIVQQCMRNLNSSSSPISGLSLSLGFSIFFCCRHYRSTFLTESCLGVHEEPKLNPRKPKYP